MTEFYITEFLNFIGLFYARVAIPYDNFIFKFLYSHRMSLEREKKCFMESRPQE